MSDDLHTQSPADHWAIDYEECGLGEQWVYKFDHDPVADGDWRKLNADSDGYYRIVDDRIQMVGPCETTGHEQFRGAFEQIRRVAPLHADGTLEIVIRCDSDGLSVHERGATIAVRAQSLLRESLRAASDALSQMPNRWA